MASKQTETFKESYDQLNNIANELKSNMEIDIDVLLSKVKTAVGCYNKCKTRLEAATKELDDILQGTSTVLDAKKGKIVNLSDAVIKNDATQVSKLLAQGIDPNFVEDDACVTPLHHAAQNDSLEAAVVLVNAGARTDSLTHDGYTPLEIAKMHGSNKMVKFLTERQKE